MSTEYFYIFTMSIEFVGDEHASSKVRCTPYPVRGPFFGTLGFSACGDVA
jgi:hypothetical protein